MTRKGAGRITRLAPVGLFLTGWGVSWGINALPGLWWLWALLGGVAAFYLSASIPTAYARLYRREEPPDPNRITGRR